MGLLYLELMFTLAYLQSETRKMYQTLMEEDSENFKGFTIGPEYVQQKPSKSRAGKGRVGWRI